LYYMPCPSHPPWLDHSNYTWRRVRIVKLPQHIIAYGIAVGEQTHIRNFSISVRYYIPLLFTYDIFRYILLGNSFHCPFLQPLNPPIIQKFLQLLQANLFLIPSCFTLKSFNFILLFSSVIHLSIYILVFPTATSKRKRNKENKFTQQCFMSLLVLQHEILLVTSMALFLHVKLPL
jgi:hypothetical protein